MALEQPYLLFLGDAPDALAAKVAQGVKDWRPDASVGQIRLPGCNADMGLTDMTVAEVAPGGGWYTRILAPYLAENGQYIAIARDSDEGGFDTRAARARACRRCSSSRTRRSTTGSA